MNKKLMEGLGMSAVMVDADNEGYLAQQEAMAVQRARTDFRAYCEGLAASFLRDQPEPQQAKSAIKAALRELMNPAGNLDLNEAALVENFSIQLVEAVDRVAKMSPWQQTALRLAFQTPSWLKSWAIMAILIGLTLLAVQTVAR